MKKFASPWLLILSSCISPLSQYFTNSTYAPEIDGYVVTIQNDTIYGKLKLLSEEASCRTIKFRDLNGRNFRMEEVIAYNRGHDLYFKKSRKAIWVLGGKFDVFMKLVDTGKIRLFEYHYATVGYIEDDDGFREESINYHYVYYLERNGNLQLVRKIGFRKNMLAFFADSDELVERIGNKELGFRNIKQIVRIYNRK